MPYRWVRRLGRGSAGEVWEALRGDRRVAVKILHQHLDERAVDALRREALFGPVVAGHPGIVAVRDVVEVDRVTYLEMDVVDGPSLDRVLAARILVGRGPLPASIVRRFAIDVLDALGWAAATISPQDPLRFVHRDVKPANLLLGPDGRVRLTDFGVARAHAGLGLDTTDSGIAKGTPRFMAPELLADRLVDARADQFALGATMFELLAGAPLYEGADLSEVLLAALQANVARRLPLLKAPLAMARVIEKLLARDPIDRYASHLEARRALDALAVPGPTIEDLLPELLTVDEPTTDLGEPTDAGPLGGALALGLAAAVPSAGDVPTQPGVLDEVRAADGEPTATGELSLDRETTSRTGPVVAPMPPGTLPERLPERFVEPTEPAPPRRRVTGRNSEPPAAPEPPEPAPAPPPLAVAPPETTLQRPVMVVDAGEATLVLERPDLPPPREQRRRARRRRAVQVLATGVVAGLLAGAALFGLGLVAWVLLG